VLGTAYTVTLNVDQDSYPGGTVTLVAALAAGYRLIITSDVENLQPTEYLNQGGFYPEVLTASLDRATILIQQLQELADLAIQFPITDPPLNNVLPAAEERAGLVLGFDSNGNVIVVAAPTGGVGGTGPAATIAIGTVTTLAPGSPATVTNSGTSSAAILNFGIPAGAAGASGFAATLTPLAVTGAVNGINSTFGLTLPDIYTNPAAPPAMLVYAGGVFMTPTTDYSAPTYLGAPYWQIVFVNAPPVGPVTVLLLA